MTLVKTCDICNKPLVKNDPCITVELYHKFFDDGLDFHDKCFLELVNKLRKEKGLEELKGENLL